MFEMCVACAAKDREIARMEDEIARLKKYARTGLEIKCEAGFNLSEMHHFKQDDNGEFTIHFEDNLDAVDKLASVRDIVNEDHGDPCEICARRNACDYQNLDLCLLYIRFEQVRELLEKTEGNQS